RDANRVPCCPLDVHDLVGLTTAGNPTSPSASHTSRVSCTWLTSTPRGTFKPSRLAMSSVCSLSIAISRAGSPASASLTRCSSLPRCWRSSSIVPSEEELSTREPVKSSTCIRYSKYSCEPSSAGQMKLERHQRDEKVGASARVSSAATRRPRLPSERTVASDCRRRPSRTSTSHSFIHHHSRPPVLSTPHPLTIRRGGCGGRGAVGAFMAARVQFISLPFWGNTAPPPPRVTIKALQYASPYQQAHHHP